MSADNYLYVRKDGKVEERRDSQYGEPGPIVHEASSQDEAEVWAEKMCRDGLVEYGYDVEEDCS